MAEQRSPKETILIVDDEEPVRRTFREWLTGAGLDCEILAAADAESALKLANERPIDLAILDWALGAGDDGLQLLQDLYAFHPDVVAIMVTGFANQATPLDAMRMGVRDYLDKNHDLSRDTFLAAVKRQLDLIRPAKRARRINQTLAGFRAAVAKVLPLVQSTAALRDPVPLPDAIRSLVRFLVQTMHATGGILLVRHYEADGDPAETYRAYDQRGEALAVDLVPFPRSLAGTVLSMQKPCILTETSDGMVDWQPFEKGRQTILAIPLQVGAGTQAVIELFDKKGGFTPEDQALAQAAADLGTELLRQALGERQTQELLVDAVAAALSASDQVSQSLEGSDSAPSAEEPPPQQVLEQIKEGLTSAGVDRQTAQLSVELAEAIRVLALRHGKPALDHCLSLVNNLEKLLNDVTREETAHYPFPPPRG
jgi:two-component system nitrogen regulation response regulator NtrX